jgi:hypothetical protein
MKITILGSCRQHSLSSKYSVTTIQEELSYPHYSKEILEVIKYCKYNHIRPDETVHIFRTPIWNKTPVSCFEKYNNEFTSTDIFVLEIASKIRYRYNDYFVHHIATEAQYNVSIRNDILVETQTKEEIEDDILQIKKELNKPFIIVSHLVTRDVGERYNLACWLEEISLKHNIPFINPVKELNKRNVDIGDLFVCEEVLAHYNEKGHSEILKIYSEFIDNILVGGG